MGLAQSTNDLRILERKVWDLNPHAPKDSDLADRPGEPYPATFQFLIEAEAEGFEPSSHQDQRFSKPPPHRSDDLQ